jgi:hypothetical protein
VQPFYASVRRKVEQNPIKRVVRIGADLRRGYMDERIPTSIIGTLPPSRNSVLHKQHLASSRNGAQPPANAFQFSTNCILRAMDF